MWIKRALKGLLTLLVVANVAVAMSTPEASATGSDLKVCMQTGSCDGGPVDHWCGSWVDPFCSSDTDCNCDTIIP